MSRDTIIAGATGSYSFDDRKCPRPKLPKKVQLSPRLDATCKIKAGSMMLIDFKHDCIFDTVVESCENIASKTTVLSDFTSSRFIDLVKRRFCGVLQSGLSSSCHRLLKS